MLLRQLSRVPGFRRLWLRFPLGSPGLRTRFDIWSRPAYAYGVWRAAELAKSLGLAGITVAEFGVAGGLGLLALEEVAQAMAGHAGMAIEVIGFDSAIGMPPPADFRDLPHVWAEGFYRMDEPQLRRKLQSARLAVGELAETIPTVIETLRYPLGFISFDLDYYSSTMRAFRIFEGAVGSRLPRVFCYFDDLIWPERACHSEFTGEHAAIRQFNQEHPKKKISQIVNLRWMREHQSAWNEQMYVMHDFEHPLYSRNITPAGAQYRELQLDS